MLLLSHTLTCSFICSFLCEHVNMAMSLTYLDKSELWAQVTS